MAYIETSIFIDLSPEELYDVGINNPDDIPEWFEGAESVVVSANYPDIGSTIDVTYKSAGVTLKATGTVQQAERGKIFQTHYEGMATGPQTWTYEADGSGTKLTLTFDYEMAGGGVGKIMDKLLVERQNKSNFEKSLKNLKARVES